MSSYPLTVALDAGRSYPIHFGPLAEAPDRMDEADLRPGHCLVVTDENVAPRYRSPLLKALKRAGWKPKTIVLPPEEPTKSAASLQHIYDEAFDEGIDRETPVLALGGGVIGDLAGFAAATLLRGVPLVQLPTSLIAQVDSAIGGKTGINHAAGKNLIGAFYQPDLVLADTDVLQTLPRREWTSGLAEAIKHALIGDPSLMAFLEDHRAAVLDCRPEVVASLIPHAARTKVDVVSEDERETGRRSLLNFGHTFAHAIEKVAGYGTLTHGEAVALGMRAALVLSREHAADFDAAAFERADRLVRMVPLPPSLPDLSFEKLWTAMQSDKKARAGTVRFVLLRKIGKAYLTDALSIENLEAAWALVQEDLQQEDTTPLPH